MIDTPHFSISVRVDLFLYGATTNSDSVNIQFDGSIQGTYSKDSFEGS